MNHSFIQFYGVVIQEWLNKLTKQVINNFQTPFNVELQRKRVRLVNYCVAPNVFYLKANGRTISETT